MSIFLFSGMENVLIGYQIWYVCTKNNFTKSLDIGKGVYYANLEEDH